MNWLQRKIESYRIDRYAKKRRRDFDVHFKTLDEQERRLLTDGEHPSQSYERSDEAKPTAIELEKYFDAIGCSVTVELGRYHFDRIIFRVVPVSKTIPKRCRLRFYHGFEILHAEKPGER